MCLETFGVQMLLGKCAVGRISQAKTKTGVLVWKQTIKKIILIIHMLLLHYCYLTSQYFSWVIFIIYCSIMFKHNIIHYIHHIKENS